MTQLPTPEEYEYIRMVAAQYLKHAKAVSNNDLGVRLDFPPEPGDEHWAFRVHVFEKDVDQAQRQRWTFEGTESEMKQAVDAVQ